MKENIAIIGASYLQLPLILKAKEMGYITHVFAWKANDVGEKEADYFYPISIVEKDEILKKCTEIKIVGICSIASDLAMNTVNYVAEKLGLIGNGVKCNERCTNKHLMRLCFEENGDPSPKSVLVNKNSDINTLTIGFPAIIKPTDRSGSRGIFLVNSYDEMKHAINESMTQSFEHKALIEEYATGDEYSIECVSFKGVHHMLAVTKKFTTGAPHFIETGHMEPSLLSDDMIEKVTKIIYHALNSLGVKFGASHSEIKIDNDGNIKIIEIGARMGGDCIGSHLVRYSTGYDYVKMVIDIACGKEPSFKKICNPMNARVQFILNENDLLEFEEIKRNESDKILDIIDFHPENIGKYTDSSNRAGCYILKVENETR